MARSEYIYVAESYPRGGPVTASTVKRELPGLLLAYGRPVSVSIFRAGKLIRYIRPSDLAEWLDS